MHKYCFEFIVGEGAFGKVYLAQQRKKNEKFAIKSMKKNDIFKDNRILSLLIKEVNLLIIMDHPNIVKLYEVYENEEYLFLVMEYLKDGDMMTQFNKKGLFSEKEASIIIYKLLQALKYCHSMNIIHRDLKPENIMMM